MELIESGWFHERNRLWPGQSLSLEIKTVLHHEKSKYQDILLVETTNHGRALILDGIVQCTEHDEHSYQEMMAMVPLCAHDRPSSVLIVGGGDGGVAREVAKHPLVESIHQVEIDERVVELSRRHLPHMASGFDSAKLTLHIGDGFDFMKKHKGRFDVVITDSGDPVGPNASLFHENYFRLVGEALRPGGLMCSQAGATWIDLPHIRRFVDACRLHFPVTRYANVSVPTYPTGQIGLLIGCLTQDSDPTVPRIKLDADKLALRYYNHRLHSASFALPNFVRKQLFD